VDLVNGWKQDIAAVPDTTPYGVTLLSFFFLQIALAQPQPDAPQDTETTVHLIATGGTGGIGSGRYQLSDPRTLGLGDILSASPHHSALVQGNVALISKDRSAMQAATLLGEQSLSCDADRDAWVRFTPTEVLAMDPQHATIPTTDTNESGWTLRDCTTPQGTKWTALVGPGSTIPRTLSAFEWRLALDVETVTPSGENAALWMIGRPDEDAARRAHVLRERRKQRPDALYVDAGDFLDGISTVQEGALSLHRPTSLALLRDLKPTALAAGQQEWLTGLPALAEEAQDLPYVLTNVHEGSDHPFPAVQTVQIEGKQRPLRIAFLGVTELWSEASSALREPVSAVQQAVDSLQQTDPHDLVVVLGHLKPDTLFAMQSRLRGVDLVLGDSGPRPQRSQRQTWEVPTPRDHAHRSPIVLPLHGVVDVAITVRNEGNHRIVATTHPITTHIPPDQELLSAINAVRAEHYPERAQPLIATEATSVAAPLSQERWEQILCESVRLETTADVVLLPELPTAPGTPGPWSELLVSNHLDTEETLVVHRIHGDRLARLLDKGWGVVPNACGATLGSKSPKIDGRSVEAERIYRVVTTTRAEASVAIKALLDESHATGWLDQPTRQALTNTENQPVTLRAAVLNTLTLQRERHGEPIATLPLEGSKRRPLWLLRARSLSTSLEAFEGANDERYASLPETLATSPSSFTMSVLTDIAIEHNSADLLWDVRHKVAYTELHTQDDRQEPADDWQLSSSITLPFATLPAPVRLMPYIETLYDSEFTPVVDELGSELARQQDLSLTMGLSAVPASRLRRARLGGFVLQDLAVPDAPIEAGLRGDAELKLTLFPGVTWTTWTDAYLFATRPDATDGDLRFKALTESRIQATLARWLATGVYLRSFAFAGQTDNTKKLGHAWTLGAAIDLGGTFTIAQGD